jgi:hypothetical protein
MMSGRVRRAAGWWLLLGVAGVALPSPLGGFAAEPPVVAGLQRLEGTWLALDATVHGWRYVTRYDISLTGNRVVAIGELVIVSPRGLAERYSPRVSEFSGTIDGDVLNGEVSLYRRIPHQHGVEWTRPMRGRVDLERPEIAIQYSGPALDGAASDEAESWHDADRTLTLRWVGKKQRPASEEGQGDSE